MKVAYFHHSGDLYGASKSLLYLIIELRKKGVDPLVILAEDGPFHSVLLENGIRVELLTSVPVLRRKIFRSYVSFFQYCFYYVKSFNVVTKLLRKHAIDIVHSNDMMIGFFPGIIAKIMKLPHVCHIRTNVSEFKTSIKLVGWLLPALSDVLICISKTVLLQFGSQPDPKMKLVYNGLPLDIINLKLPFKKDFRSNLGFSQGDKVICCVGRINSWKGQDFLARAFASIAHELPDNVKLLFVGDSYPGSEFYQTQLEASIEQLGIRERTTQISFITDVRSVYEAIDILVVPSIVPEPFGLVVVEGMTYGCPIIAANHGGPSEILKDHVTGLLYEPGDLQGLAERIRQLVVDDSLRLELATNAAKFMKNSYSIAETADSVYNIYRSCLSG